MRWPQRCYYIGLTTLPFFLEAEIFGSRVTAREPCLQLIPQLNQIMFITTIFACDVLTNIYRFLTFELSKLKVHKLVAFEFPSPLIFCLLLTRTVHWLTSKSYCIPTVVSFAARSDPLLHWQILPACNAYMAAYVVHARTRWLTRGLAHSKCPWTVISMDPDAKHTWALPKAFDSTKSIYMLLGQEARFQHDAGGHISITSVEPLKQVRRHRNHCLPHCTGAKGNQHCA